ncbi:MAG: ribulose-phosphate 3-epimerase [Patescibacteria group bacterium]|jgi:ribulose-phosphate 3-epimerase
MIIPTILTADIDQVEKKLSFLKGQVDRVQIDVVDGKFASNKTITPSDLLGLAKKNNFLLDFHLMVEDPAAYLDKQNWPGETNLVTAQIEAMPSQIEFIRQAKEKGFLAGLALDLKTKISKLDKQTLDMVDQVLLLGVEAGFSGQEIDPQILPKIKDMVVWRGKERWFFKIGVDGGVDKTSLAFCHKMGAEEFYIGSALWESKDPIGAIRRLEKIVNSSK